MKQFLVFAASAALALSAAAQPAPGSNPSGTPSPAGGSVVGAVKQVDASRRVITVSGFSRRDPDRVLNIPADLRILRVVSARQTDLKVGDSISIQGLPLLLSASQVRIGDELPGHSTASPQPPAPRAPRTPRSGPSPGSRLYARITRLNPLMAQLPDGPTFEIRTSPKTRFTRLQRIAIGQVKPGDPVAAFGSVQADGSVLVRRLQIGLEAMPFVRR